MIASYAGIGSRSTPLHILAYFTLVAARLETLGFTLHSGGASGADAAFEEGVVDPHNAKIFLPWRNFNNNPSALFDISTDAYAMAKSFHPAWGRCGSAARALHARNCYQVMGLDLESPVDFVLCWTPNAEVTGGTGQALRIAMHHNIPIFNFGSDDSAVVRTVQAELHKAVDSIRSKS